MKYIFCLILITNRNLEFVFSFKHSFTSVHWQRMPNHYCILIHILYLNVSRDANLVIGVLNTILIIILLLIFSIRGPSLDTILQSIPSAYGLLMYTIIIIILQTKECSPQDYAIAIITKKLLLIELFSFCLYIQPPLHHSNCQNSVMLIQFISFF